MAKALVTGGAGFIGSHVAQALLARGHEVGVLDDLSGGFQENVPPGARFVQGSILDYELLRTLFSRERFDYVYHLAAYAAEGLSHFIKRFNYQNNLIGSINLINLSILHQVRCFVFTSSIAVYGKGQVPMSEEMMPEPEDSYGIAKRSVEQELKISQAMFGLPYVIFRPHNVYGERQNIGDRYRNVVGIFMNQVMRGEPMPVFGDGSQKRAFSYIDDVAPIIARSVEIPEASGQVFNIGTDDPCTIKDLALEVARIFGVPPNLRFLPPRNEVDAAYADHSRSRVVFKTGEPTPLRQGLERMALWARRHGVRSSKEFKDIEVRLNLPPSWQT